LITQFTPITRTMPFQISLLITSLAGDWLLRNMVPTLSTFPANAISSLMLSLTYQNSRNCMMNNISWRNLCIWWTTWCISNRIWCFFQSTACQ
jgi:hypothetical protein